MSRVSMFDPSWTASAALAHIEKIEARDHARAFCRALCGDDNFEIEDVPLTDQMKRTVRRNAIDGLLLALRDGYVRATGRRSNTPRLLPRSEAETWCLHATDPTLITTAEWLEGEYSVCDITLTGPTWQYIQIAVPDFMVKAIWPDDEQEARLPTSDETTLHYSTPYLELMQEAIEHFALTAHRQQKKESLTAWFRTKKVEGKFVSGNLANAMATLIRLPTAQRGGAKRMSGPDLRSAK